MRIARKGRSLAEVVPKKPGPEGGTSRHTMVTPQITFLEGKQVETEGSLRLPLSSKKHDRRVTWNSSSTAVTAIDPEEG